MQCDHLVNYVIEARVNNLELMNMSDEAYHFYFYQGKVMAYSEVLRVIEEECK